jgi:hypothetical protein
MVRGRADRHTDTPTPYSETESTSTATATAAHYRRHARARSEAAYTYTADDSFSDSAEVEAALAAFDDDVTETEETLSHWARAGPRSQTTTPSLGGASTRFTERTADTRSVGSSGSSSYGRPGVYHSRYTTDPGASTILSATDYTAPPARRAGDLIAYFESASEASTPSSLAGHSRTASVPIGPRSPSPSKYGSSYGGYGYRSRPGSPSKFSGTVSPPSSSLMSPTSSVLSPSVRPTSSLGTYTTTRSPYTATSAFTRTSPYAGSISGSNSGGSSSGSTARPLSAAGTYTSVPYTATSAPYTTTSAPYTTTSAPYTAASVPYTATSAPYTATTSPYSATSSPYTTMTSPYTTTTSPYTATTSPYTATSAFTTSLPTNTSATSYTASSYTATATSIAPLRRPQPPTPADARSPLTSVRNIIAAWKERTPLSERKAARAESTLSVNSSTLTTTSEEGLFSLRRRAERGSIRRQAAASTTSLDTDETPRKPSGARSSSGVNLPPPFEISELGGPKTDQEVCLP